MTHQEKVERIVRDVKDFYKRKKPFRIFHGSTNSTRIQQFRRADTIDASDLDEVLKIDGEKQIVTVEPNVPMDKLARATLRRGLVPKVVMEFPGITSGGGLAGVAGESSSFRHGVFGPICDNIEIITPDGVVRTASRGQDLYQGIGGTYGTLGILTALDIECRPAKKYVNLTYLPVKSFQDAVDTLMAECAKDHDYVDGIMFAKNRGVVMVGRLSDQRCGHVQRFSRAIDPWFYLHAEKYSPVKHTESIPLTDYLFRYDRGAFWMGKWAFELFGVPFNALTRWLHNPLMHTRKMYEVLQAGRLSEQYLVQDLGLPLKNAVNFMKFIDKELGVYPLWLCPILPAGEVSEFQVNSMNGSPMCINIGVWGNKVADYDEFLRQNRAVEKELMKLGGRKWFYAHAYYTEKEFWQIYDKKWYDGLRRKYHAEHMPSVFDKVVVKKKYQVDAKKGAWSAILGKGKLKVR
jgi:hypothetical protein